jgi:hypothetical protein
LVQGSEATDYVFWRQGSLKTIQGKFSTFAHGQNNEILVCIRCALDTILYLAPT